MQANEPDDSSTSIRPRPRGTDDLARRSALDVYLDRAGEYDRLTAQQERDRLRELTELRRLRWVALLSGADDRTSVLAAIRKDLDDQAPGDAIAQVERCHRENGTHRAISEAIDALAIDLERIDADGQLAERLVNDPPRGDLDDRAWEQYRQDVRRAAAAHRRARNRFVCANLRLVVMVADRYTGRWMSLADRVQEGNLGLIKAVERFDPERGTRFSTYAVWWIRHSITRALVNRGRTVRVPAHLHTVFNKLRSARRALEGRSGRPATVAELAKEVGLPVPKVQDALEAMELRAVSLDGMPREGGPSPWRGRLSEPAPQTVIEDRIDQRRNEAVALDALAELQPRDRDILERRFELVGRSRMSLEALGRSYSVSRERVRQLQNRALKTLRRAVESSPVSGLTLA